VRRGQLQHVILEIGCRFHIDGCHIVGSSAILAAIPDPPEGALTATRDVDVIPPGDDERMADRISYVLGEASDFDAEYGYYAEGVSSRTPVFAPRGWQERAIPVRVEDYTGWCMAPCDLVLSKLGAGREKDYEFVKSVAALKLAGRGELLAHLPDVACTEEDRRRIAARIDALFN